MTVKEYLLQAFTIDRILKARQSQIEELEARRYSVGAVLDDVKISAGPQQDKLGDLSAHFLDLIDEYAKDLEHLLALKRDIKRLIETLDNPTHRLIMEERYINLKRWEDIAADNNYSWNSVHRFHKAALKKIEVGIESHTLDMI